MDFEISPTNATITEGNTGTVSTGSATLHVAAVSDGTVTISVVLEDPVDNTSSPTIDTSTADLSAPAAPTVTISDGTDGEIADGESVDLTIGGEADADYNLDLINCSVTGGTGNLGGDGSETLQLTALGNDLIEVSAILTDDAGNESVEGSDTSWGTGF
jgi:hypothetical protein